ncbi:MAG: NADH-quinone oxidoreductase subunit D, partial [Bacteroidota bacterium]
MSDFIQQEPLSGGFSFWPRHNEAIYQRLESKHAWLEEKHRANAGGDGAAADALENEMILNMGPQHPATHGVLRCVVKLDGEMIERAVLDLGYLHRGIEKLAEFKTYQEFMPYTDRMDYLAPYSNNVAWCLAVEKLAAVEVPERAQWLRMIFCELARISSHLLWMGVGLMDAGAVSVFLWTFQHREDIYNIFDEVAGARFTVSHSRIGGLASDVSPSSLAMIRDFCDRFEETHRGWVKLLNRNRIWIDRNENVGTLTAEEVKALGMTGPCLRGSGIPFDMRRFEPYLKYEEVDFNIPIRTEGDCLARYFVRMEEMMESIKIIRQCLDRVPDGPIRADDAKKAYPSKDEVYYSMEGMIHDFMYTDTGITPPKGAQSYHAIEAPKG